MTIVCAKCGSASVAFSVGLLRWESGATKAFLCGKCFPLNKKELRRVIEIRLNEGEEKYFA
jgi:hypothetical protein